ncbi:MAG: hypothetical protein U1D25_07345 [Hydrogenophaga sp.]|nr:hypothetical protein [Hydrogenophaga sp.]
MTSIIFEGCRDATMATTWLFHDIFDAESEQILLGLRRLVSSPAWLQ